MHVILINNIVKNFHFSFLILEEGGQGITAWD